MLCVGGGIAAYKALELVRRLRGRAASAGGQHAEDRAADGQTGDAGAPAPAATDMAEG